MNRASLWSVDALIGEEITQANGKLITHREKNRASLRGADALIGDTCSIGLNNNLRMTYNLPPMGTSTLQSQALFSPFREG